MTNYCVNCSNYRKTPCDGDDGHLCVIATERDLITGKDKNIHQTCAQMRHGGGDMYNGAPLDCGVEGKLFKMELRR